MYYKNEKYKINLITKNNQNNNKRNKIIKLFYQIKNNKNIFKIMRKLINIILI